MDKKTTVQNADSNEKIRETLDVLQRTLQDRPNEPAIHLDISNCYLRLNNLTLAQQHLYQALRLNPHYAEAYNNLGRIFYQQQRFQEARPQFEKALRLNADYLDAHYNLAHTFSQMNQFDQAVHHYKAVVALEPKHIGAHTNLGLLLFEAEDYEAAILHLERAWALNPAMMQNDSATLLFLGQAYLALGKIDQAKKLYQTLLAENDSLIEAHHNLAVLYLREQDKSQALLHFEKTLQYQPHNETAQHMVRALTAHAADSIPQGYIRALFDQYAEYYNEHVKKTLEYQAPHLLRSAIGRCLNDKLFAGRVLDMGCGTGLCAIYFRDLARTLVGIDISEKMIAQAKKLDAYDELHVQDISEYLNAYSGPAFNLIIASDVLVYYPDLEKLFQKITQHLESGGRFAFTTEILDQGDYQLQTTGRFSHSNQYIESLAEKNGLEIELADTITLRKQAASNLVGGLFILKKP